MQISQNLGPSTQTLLLEMGQYWCITILNGFTVYINTANYVDIDASVNVLMCINQYNVYVKKPIKSSSFVHWD